MSTYGGEWGDFVGRGRAWAKAQKLNNAGPEWGSPVSA